MKRRPSMYRFFAILFIVTIVPCYSFSQESAAPSQEKAPEAVQKDDAYENEKKKAERIEKALEYGIHTERKEAIVRIILIKEPSLRKNLEDLLVEIIEKDLDVEVLIKAITTAGELDLKKASKGIAGQLENDSEQVVVSSIYTLKKLEATEYRQQLTDMLKEQELEDASRVTEALLRTLADFKATDLIPFATEQLEDPAVHDVNREQLVLFLGNLEDESTREVLEKIYTDTDEDLTIRSYAVNGLSKLKDPSITNIIRTTLEEIESYPFKKRQQHHGLYLYSVAALAKKGDKAVFPRLMNALRSNNANVRFRAATLMKELKDERTIDILRYRMEHDPSPKVRRAAREALKEMGVDVDDDETGSSEEEKAADTPEQP